MKNSFYSPAWIPSLLTCYNILHHHTPFFVIIIILLKSPNSSGSKNTIYFPLLELWFFSTTLSLSISTITMDMFCAEHVLFTPEHPPYILPNFYAFTSQSHLDTCLLLNLYIFSFYLWFINVHIYSILMYITKTLSLTFFYQLYFLIIVQILYIIYI